jgi:hypothetical protein
MKKGKGWFGESYRHGLSAKGIKTSKKKVSMSRKPRAIAFKRKIPEKIAMPRGSAKVDVTLSLAEAKKWKEEMEKRGHKCGIDRGVFGYRLYIPNTKRAVEDYNKLAGRKVLTYSKRHGVLL